VEWLRIKDSYVVIFISINSVINDSNSKTQAINFSAEAKTQLMVRCSSSVLHNKVLQFNLAYMHKKCKDRVLEGTGEILIPIPKSFSA